MDLEKAQRTQQIIQWSLIGLAVILLIFIIFRIVSRYIQNRRLNELSEKEPKIKTAVELLKEAMIGISIPPTMLFKISKDCIHNLGYNFAERKILEQKKFFRYRYFIVDFPCVFYFDSKEKIQFSNLIPVKITTEIKLTQIII